MIKKIVCFLSDFAEEYVFASIWRYIIGIAVGIAAGHIAASQGATIEECVLQIKYYFLAFTLGLEFVLFVIAHFVEKYFHRGGNQNA